MRTAFMSLLTTALLGAALLFSISSHRESAAAEEEGRSYAPTAQPQVVPAEPVAPRMLGRHLDRAAHERAARRHRAHHRPRSVPNTDVPPAQNAAEPAEPSVEVPPPAPSERDASSAAPAVLPAPLVAQPLSFRDRLLARRLSRIQQFKQSAAESGDAQALQRAEYLEGMVLQLHQQGLINFAQKMITAIQEGNAGGSSPAGPPAEIPEADLGEAAPLPLDGEAAPSESAPEAPPGNPPAADPQSE